MRGNVADSRPVLSARRLNRALLARQLLLERSGGSIVEAVEQVGGLQTQYAPSGYVGLWTRVAGFQRDALTRALAPPWRNSTPDRTGATMPAG